MKTIKNTGTTPLEIGINGTDYTFPAGEVVACEDEVADYIMEQFPLFESGRLSVGKEGDEVPRVQTKPSRIYVQQKPPTDKSMFVTPSQKKDDTLPADLNFKGKDNDGVEWVGEGIESDSIS